MDQPAELELASERIERTLERVIRDEGYGSTIGGLAISSRWLETLIGKLKLTLASDPTPLSLLLKELEVEVLGTCLLNSCLHTICTGALMREMALFIGSQLQAECWAAGLLRFDRGLAKRIEKAAKLRNGNVSYRRQAARSMAAREGYKAKRWAEEQKLRAGAWGLHELLAALPEVFVVEEATKVREEDYVTLTPEALAVADAALEEAIKRKPTWLPSTERPKPWTEPFGGGSWDERLSQVSVVRAHDRVRGKAVAHSVRSGQMQPALDALNVLQDVAWTINAPVLRFQHWAWHNRAKLPGFPPRDDISMPEHGDWESMSSEERKAWKLRASAVKRDNRTYRCDRLLLLEDLHTASDMQRARRFFTPMNMDWRGRVYPLSYFNYTRSDRVRSLFLFADGEEMTEEGMYWLKVHVANLSDGFDPEDCPKPSKLSFNGRVEWVDRNLWKIQHVAACSHPETRPEYAASYLSKLDEPFLWLAAAIELANAVRCTGKFITHLPIAFDGSCSGLQHLCAMTRAPEGALVNLTPTERPQDVYQTVADLVGTKIANEASDPTAACTELAKLCLAYGITRSLVKRNVMTYSYSSKQFGMAEQHREDLMEPLRRKVTLGELAAHPFGDQAGKAAVYLARTTYAAIEEVVNLPAQAMTFLQTLAKALAHEGKPVRWTTPIGLPWINRYTVPVTDTVALYLHDHGVRYRVKLAIGEEKGIDKDSAASGVAPNFVHALDAAHLLRTVLAARDAGVTNVATVHDSFGCLAPRAARFRDIIRSEFVRLYQEHDVLAEVLAQAKQDLSEANHDKLPELPSYGPLDISEVLNAPYCFA